MVISSYTFISIIMEADLSIIMQQWKNIHEVRAHNDNLSYKNYD